MNDRDALLAELVDLSRWLGATERDCTILGEGNTSASIDGDRFLVKASGTSLGSIDPSGFVEMRRAAVLTLLDEVTAEEAAALDAAKADPSQAGAPSVETPLHAVCLDLPSVQFVGHTHPTAINSITCAKGFAEALGHRMFPDQIIACGPRSLQVPCVSPGIQLGRALRAALAGYLDQWGEPPKTIYLRNHGFVALGSSAKEVRALTQMAVKAARILQGTLAFGGPHDWPTESVADPHH